MRLILLKQLQILSRNNAEKRYSNVDLYHKKAQKNDDYERPGEHGIV